jgi:hypothetical protein
VAPFALTPEQVSDVVSAYLSGASAMEHPVLIRLAPKCQTRQVWSPKVPSYDPHL